MPADVHHTTVRFTAPDKATALIGDFTNWDRSPPIPVRGELEIEFPPGAWVEYAWLDPEGKPIADPQGHKTLNPWYSVARGVEVGKYARHPWLEFQIPPEMPVGKVDRHTWQGNLFKGNRRAYIYTPPDYSALKTYPVYYIQDGVAFYRTGRLSELTDLLLSQGQIKPMVLVFLEPQDRTQEYYLNSLYGKFLQTEVLPYVESNFSVSRKPEGRGLWGASLGGLISLFTAMNHPELFGRVISHSGAFIAHPHPPHINGKPDPLNAGEWLLEQVMQRPPKHLKISLDTGILEWLCGPNRRMAGLFADLNIRHQYREYTSGHNWVSWRNALPDALLYMQGV